MAKKEENLPFEERLKKAIVPSHLEPFKIPSNWQWVRLGCLGYTNIGLTYKPKDVSPNGVIVLRSNNIQNGVIDYNDIIKVNINVPESKISRKGDILICVRNGSKALVGKTALIDADGMSYGAFMAIFRSKYNRLIYYYLNSPYFRDLIDREVGTTTINQITQSIIKELPFPLPPLAEQKRIVDRIESLFAKLDQAKELAQNALDTFETRKAAILHKAFTGELTAKWREKNGVGMESWEEKALENVANIISGYAFASQDFDIKHEIPCVKITNVGVGVYLFEDTDDRLPASYLNEYEHFIVNEGDILISLTRSYINSGLKVCIYPDNRKALLNQRVALIRYCNNKYLFYYLRTTKALNYVKEKSKTTNQPNLSIKDLAKMIIPIPSLPEQQEITKILDSLFEKEQKAKELCDAIIDKIDLIKKAILAKAFRGELGTNDLNEESVVELLKECLSQPSNYLPPSREERRLSN